MGFMKTIVLPNQSTQILLGTLLLWAGSEVAIPLPFTPIPVTLQTLVIFVLAGLSRQAVWSVIGYLMIRTVVDPCWVIGPKAGFLISFIPAVLVIQALRLPIFIALAIGQLVIFGIGAFWLGCFVGASKAIAWGVVPFVGGALLKIALAAGVLHDSRTER